MDINCSGTTPKQNNNNINKGDGRILKYEANK